MAIETPFGRELRHWRRVRGLSQLELAFAAATTPRHLSFLETGRSRPSRDMVDRLCEALTIPLRERNLLFEAAGLAAAYTGRGLSSEDLAPFDAVLDRMLAQHEPFPAFVVDRAWTIVRANRAAAAMLEGTAERNAARLLYEGPWRAMMQNWEAVAWNGVSRLRDDLARYPDDPDLVALLDLALRTLKGVPKPADTGSDRVVCPHFAFGDEVVRTLTVVARFGSPRDVTIDELRVEMIYPQDEAADRFFRAAAREPDLATAL